MVDIHCHILPALDDGAKDLENSLEMCRMAANDGIEAIVCTAHASDRYPFDPDLVERKIQEVTAKSGGVPRLYPGCDFHLSYENLQSALAEPRPFTINHGQYLLVEFADFAIPPRMDQTFFQLRSRGMVPIVTHPERNSWLLSSGRETVRMGGGRGAGPGDCRIPAGTFRRVIGPLLPLAAGKPHDPLRRQRRAQHHAPPSLLRAAYDKVAGQFGHDLAELIFNQYPRAALESEPISPEPPTLPSRKTFFDRMVDRFRP